MEPELSLQQARQRFYRDTGLAEDGGIGPSWWRFSLGALPLCMPNFRWRQDAVHRHDMHHILTGYPCNFAGEIQVAAWELSAGRYPHFGATAFCLPLLAIGSIAYPRRTFAAAMRGQHSRTLYCARFDPVLLDLPIDEVRRQYLPARLPPLGMRHVSSYLGLLLQAHALTFGPLLLGLWLWGFVVR